LIADAPLFLITMSAVKPVPQSLTFVNETSALTVAAEATWAAVGMTETFPAIS